MAGNGGCQSHSLCCEMKLHSSITDYAKSNRTRLVHRLPLVSAAAVTVLSNESLQTTASNTPLEATPSTCHSHSQLCHRKNPHKIECPTPKFLRIVATCRRFSSQKARIKLTDMEHDVFPLLLGKPDGSLVSKTYDAVPDEIERFEPFPDPSHFTEFESYHSAVAQWRRKVSKLKKHVIFPYATFQRTPIPVLPQTSKVPPSNYNYIVSRILDGRPITSDEVLPQKERRVVKRVSEYFVDRPAPLVLMPPMPELFDAKEEFFEASLKWMEQTRGEGAPAHPCEFRDVVHVNISEGRVFRQPEDSAEAHLKVKEVKEVCDERRLSMLLFALRVSQGPVRPRNISIDDVLARDAPANMRHPLVKFVNEMMQFGVHSSDKNDVYRWYELEPIGRAMSEPSRAYTQSDPLFLACQLDVIRSWRVKYQVYSVLRELIAPCPFERIENAFLNNMDRLMSVVELVAAFDPRLSASIGLMRNVWQQLSRVQNSTFYDIANTFLIYRLCMVFCELLQTTQRQNSYFSSLNQEIKIFVGRISSGSIARMLVEGLSPETGLVVVFVIHSFLVLESAEAFLRSFDPEPTFFRFLDQVARVSRSSFNYLSMKLIHDKYLLSIVYPHFVTYLRTVDLGKLSDGMFNMACYLVSVNSKALPKGMKYDWVFDIFSSNLSRCCNERIAVFAHLLIELSCRLCQNVWSRKVAQNTAESIVLGLTGYFHSQPMTSSVLLKSMRCLFVLKPVRAFAEKAYTQLASVTALLASPEPRIRIGAWKVFRTWFLVSYKRMAKFLKAAAFRRDIAAGLYKPTDDIMPVIMKLINVYAEKHISIDTTGGCRDEGINNAFIFIYSGIPIEMVELASLFTDANLHISLYLRATREVPALTENKKTVVILNQFLRVLSMRNALRQLLNIRHDEI